MKIYETPEQGSVAWLKLRLGIPTASGFGKLMTNSFEPRKGEMPLTYMYQRLAEAITGDILPTNGGTAWSCEQGTILEEEAIPFFEFHTGLKARRVSHVESDDGRCGCSPDALVGEDAGLEIKCPFPQTHVSYLLEGELPDEYKAQVHGGLYVTGRARWHFMSYSRDMQPFHMVVERDEEIMGKIHECLTAYYKKFDAALAKLKP